jgi:hypothetical protein
VGHRHPERAQIQSLRGAAQGDEIREVGKRHGAGTFASSSSTQVCAVMPRACAV